MTCGSSKNRERAKGKRRVKSSHSTSLSLVFFRLLLQTSHSRTPSLCQNQESQKPPPRAVFPGHLSDYLPRSPPGVGSLTGPSAQEAWNASWVGGPGTGDRKSPSSGQDRQCPGPMDGALAERRGMGYGDWDLGLGLLRRKSSGSAGASCSGTHSGAYLGSNHHWLPSASGPRVPSPGAHSVQGLLSLSHSGLWAAGRSREGGRASPPLGPFKRRHRLTRVTRGLCPRHRPPVQVPGVFQNIYMLTRY